MKDMLICIAPKRCTQQRHRQQKHQHLAFSAPRRSFCVAAPHRLKAFLVRLGALEHAADIVGTTVIATSRLASSE